MMRSSTATGNPHTVRGVDVAGRCVLHLRINSWSFPEMEPTGRQDHVALDVSETGQELQKLPPGENLAEIQIRGLLWLEEPGNEVYLKAHRTWEAQDVLFASRIDNKKKEGSALRNEVYQLFGFFSVFQGVLLTAVANSSYLHCHNWWTAFFLGLFAAIFTIGGIIQKFRAILALEKTIKNEAHTRQECINRVAKLVRKRAEFDFAVDARDGVPRPFDMSSLRVYVIVVFVSLIFFSGLFLASIQQILCDPGPSDLSSDLTS